MKYKVLKSNTNIKNKKTDYIYKKFCLDKKISADEFVHCVKSTYYNYDASVYKPNYINTQKLKFKESLKQLPQNNYAIVDIGAGTGESFKIFNDIDFQFSKYYFIEPFKKMIQQFDKKDDDKVIIINDYFESSDCTKILCKEENPKLFLMCASLRSINNINEFADILNQNMKTGDSLFLPVEPNNDYFGKYFNFLRPLIFLKGIFLKLGVLFSSDNSNTSSTNNISPLSLALNDLKKNGVVGEDFTTAIIYSIVYPNNYYCWINIDIPEDYNDGFFTLDEFAKRSGCKIDQIRTEIYLYGFSFGISIIDKIAERFLIKVFQIKGLR